MPEMEEAGILLDKLGRKVWEKRNLYEPAFPGCPPTLSVYRKHGAWPGRTYTHVGNSYNTEYLILGSEMEARRNICMTLLFERKGNRQYCVRLGEALSFEGFREVLSTSEQSWLTELPEDTFISPALDSRGQRIRSTFAVWKKAADEPAPHLLTSRR